MEREKEKRKREYERKKKKEKKRKYSRTMQPNLLAAREGSPSAKLVNPGVAARSQTRFVVAAAPRCN